MKLNRKSAAVIALFAFFVQVVIISYNHLTGFINIKDLSELLQRIMIGTIFSSAFGIITVYIDLKIINLLDKRYTWQSSPLIRFIFEASATIGAGIFTGTSVTLTAHIPFPYDELSFHIINNSLITIIINIIVIAALEAVLYFRRNQAAQVKAEMLEKENAQVKLETLKHQLNPHFLFNSLNVLSALIRKDTPRAQQFIDEFSSVYRYILDVIDKPVVALESEIAFAKSYMLLQQIRFEDSVKFDINIEASRLKNLIPPLAVQTLLENALKHNKAQKENPLCIKIFNNGNFLFVTNNLQLKINGVHSNGIGLDNLKKRYLFTAGLVPEFSINQNEFISKLPLIDTD